MRKNWSRYSPPPVVQCNSPAAAANKEQKNASARRQLCTCRCFVSGPPPRLTASTFLSATDNCDPVRCRRKCAATLRGKRASRADQTGDGTAIFRGDEAVRQMPVATGMRAAPMNVVHFRSPTNRSLAPSVRSCRKSSNAAPRAKISQNGRHPIPAKQPGTPGDGQR